MSSISSNPANYSSSYIDLGAVEPVTGLTMTQFERKTTPVSICHECNKYYEDSESDLYYVHANPHIVIQTHLRLSNAGKLEMRSYIDNRNPGRLGCLCKYPS
jgi:hypothetical protein